MRENGAAKAATWRRRPEEAVPALPVRLFKA
jgi:hypothetical protein